MTKHNPRSLFAVDWMSPEEAASYLNLSKPTIRKMVKDGRLDAHRLGYRTVRITMNSVEKMLEAAKQ